MTLFYDFARVAMNGLLLAFSRLEVVGQENVPAEGPFILVCNHLNLADPPVLGAVIHRDIVFMAKEELFHQPGMSLVVKSYGAFPVKRNKPDREALRRATRVLAGGGVLGLFPEGKRNPRTGMTRAEAGVALIALRSQSPVLPVGIAGTEQIGGLAVVVRRPRIRVKIGSPFTVPKVEARVDSKMLAVLADRLMYRVAELLPPAYRGVYAGSNPAGESRLQLASDGESR